MSIVLMIIGVCMFGSSVYMDVTESFESDFKRLTLLISTYAAFTLSLLYRILEKMEKEN